MEGLFGNRYCVDLTFISPQGLIEAISGNEPEIKPFFQFRVLSSNLCYNLIEEPINDHSMKMNILKKHWIAAIAVALFSLPVMAQGPGGQGPGRSFQMTEEDIKARVDNLAENLSLTEDQHQKILDYELEFYNKRQIEFQKMRNNPDAPPDREAMRANMQKMREERDQKYAEVLTKEQMEKYRQIQEQRRNEMRRQYQEGNPGGQEPNDRPARGRGRN
jgi:Spy/CpxP family protein refolding chaperone